ncbi:hypothetical protein VNO78_06412 [Psophocarpus tetragonolobus]|uniref:Epidermal patterning factor-like protein n=1 Tax=Psophocarpus tetragonolobus TaxID=3891 RepID=A0AAN9T1I8_PSOTE
MAKKNPENFVSSLNSKITICNLLDLDLIIAMRVSICIATFLVAFFFSTTQMVVTVNNDHHHDQDQLKHSNTMGAIRSRRGRTLQIAGSGLPDCMHACGSCSPCRLVTVGFACFSLTHEAESCPISYRCMCNSKSYPIP